MALKLTFQDVYSRVGEYLGVGSAPTGTDLLTVKRITLRGYNRFLYPVDPTTGRAYSWKFLEQTTTLSVVANQDTYDLPTGWAAFVAPLRYTTPTSTNPVEKSLDWIMEQKSLITGTGYPLYYAIQSGKYDQINGQRYKIVFHPTPSAALEFYYTYTLTPVEPTQDAEVFVGDGLASETILECALAVAEIEKYDVPDSPNPNVHGQEADRLMQMCIVADKRRNLVPNLGKITDGDRVSYVRNPIVYDQSGNQILP